MQALLGFTSEARWLRHARAHPGHLPRQPGYNKAQLALERHGGRTPAGVAVRVLQRILALTTAIWHSDHTDQPVKRSLTAYDHQPLESII